MLEKGKLQLIAQVLTTHQILDLQLTVKPVSKKSLSMKLKVFHCVSGSRWCNKADTEEGHHDPDCIRPIFTIIYSEIHYTAHMKYLEMQIMAAHQKTIMLRNCNYFSCTSINHSDVFLSILRVYE